MRAKKRILIPSALAVAVLAGVIAFTASPVPASLLMRRMFEKPSLAAPEGFDAMEASVEVHRDLEYPSVFGDNYLDLYLPKSAAGALPVVLWIHGGAYVGGDKSDIRYYAAALASEGYAVVSMNYARAPEARYPAPLVQMGEVIAWISAGAEEYAIDPSRIVLAGDSAGAHCAALFALAHSNPSYAEMNAVEPSVPPENIRGLLLYCGPYNVKTTYEISGLFGAMIRKAGWAFFGDPEWGLTYEEQLSVKDHLTAAFPPAFVTDSSHQSFAQQGMELVDAMETAGVDVTGYFPEAEFEKTSHEYQFRMDTPAGAECYRRTVEFLADVMRDQFFGCGLTGK